MPILRRRISYYVAVGLVFVLIHTPVIGALAGSGVGDLFRRNSEGFLLMLLVPAHWDWFTAGRHPSAIRAPALRPRATHLVWLIGLLTASIVMGTLSELPQEVITLGEATLAAAAVGGYLAWSRQWFVSGAGTGVIRPAGQRLWYYVVVVVLAVASAAPRSGQPVVELLHTNIEALVAMVVLPLYFDVVAPTSGRHRLWVWLTVMVLIPVAAQPGALGSTSLAAVADWFVRGTEAFLAGFVVAAGYELAEK